MPNNFNPLKPHATAQKSASKSEHTPVVVKSLLVILEQCFIIIQQQAEEIEVLKDEVRVLKGEKKRPAFKPSKLDKKTDKAKAKDSASTKKKKRPGSNKRSKNATLTIATLPNPYF